MAAPDQDRPPSRAAVVVYGIIDLAVDVAIIHRVIAWRVNAAGPERIWGLWPGDLALFLSVICLLLIPFHWRLYRRAPARWLGNPVAFQRWLAIAVLLLVLALLYAYRCQHAWATM